MTDQELQTWLDEKIAEYQRDKADCLELMLHNTTCIMQQFIDNPASHAAKGVYENSLKCNYAFLEAIGDLDEEK